MRAEGETKGVIKRGEVVTEMCAQGFSFFYFPLLGSLLCVNAYLHAESQPCMC